MNKTAVKDNPEPAQVRDQKDKYVLDNELFFIKDGSSYMIYSPLKGAIVRVNSAALRALKNINSGHPGKKFLNRMLSLGIIGPAGSQKDAVTVIDEKPRPQTSITLFPTTRCNLRCSYCFASGGDRSVDMSYETAVIAISHILEDCKRMKRIRLSFHGGGEPTMNMPLIRKVTRFVRMVSESSGINPSFSICTNGVFSEDNARWIAENINSVTLSMDGPRDLQDLQRPMRNGGSSFDNIMRTVSTFRELNKKLNVRTTVTANGVDRIKESILFFKNLGIVSTIQAEPVFECGRCLKMSICSPSPQVFLRNFLEARSYAISIGMNLHYSTGPLGEPKTYFCGALGHNFFVTPEGLVTSCLEIARLDDPRSAHFIYGRIRDGEVQIDTEKIALLRKRTVFNLKQCQDCFAKFSCAGDCPAKISYLNKDMYDTSNNSRCEINKGVVLDEMRTMLRERSGGEHE
jgi:uncharacterized protein